MSLWIPAAVYPCGSRGGNDTVRVFVIPAEAGIHSQRLPNYLIKLHKKGNLEGFS